MLPLIGAKKLIQMSDASSSSSLVPDLIEGIGGDERGKNKNSGAIKDLLGKLLSQLRIEMSSPNPLHDDDEKVKKENKRDRRRKERLAKKNAQVGIETSTMDDVEKPSQLPVEWVKVWAYPLSSALLFSSANRRNQTAAFCLPLLSVISGSREEAPHAYGALIEEVELLWKQSLDSNEANREHLTESCLWSKLEVSQK